LYPKGYPKPSFISSSNQLINPSTPQKTTFTKELKKILTLVFPPSEIWYIISHGNSMIFITPKFPVQNALDFDTPSNINDL
jgi:hypothetical protein